MKKIQEKGIRKFVGIIASAIIVYACMVGIARAWETTEFWTPCVEDVHPYGIPELMIGNFFSVYKKSMVDADGSPNALASDIGFEIGVLPFDKINMEIGVDGIYPSADPYLFNAKLGTPEDSMFKGAPGLAVGIFNVGTNPSTTAADIGTIVIGKTIPYINMRLHLGYYVGNHAVLLGSTGQPNNQDWMVAVDRTFNVGKDWMDSLTFAADYAAGKNMIGGGGFGTYLNWTKNISLLIGPTWFNDAGLMGAWKWTTQVYINF